VNSVDDCRLIDLPKIFMPEGSITPIEGPGDILPFEIARVYYIYDVVGGAMRGGHAHKELEQFIVAVMGGLIVTLWDGEREREVELNRAYQGLYVPPTIWTALGNFSSGAVTVVLASHHFEEADYIRHEDEFAAYRRQPA
jgi:hypothetical protein